MEYSFNNIFEDDTKNVERVSSNEYLEKGNIAIIDQGKEQIIGYTNNTNYKVCKEERIIFGDHTRVFKYVNIPFITGADGTKVLKIKDTNRCKYKYYYYYLLHSYIPNTGYNRHFKWVKELKFKIPAIDEQLEIIKKLDNVTNIINLKKLQLEQLQNVIKSQFVEMFGDPFLNDKNWKTSTIGNCCTLKSGNSLPAEIENEGGDILYIKVGDMNLKENEKYITTSSHRVTDKTAGNGIFELGTILFPKRGGAIGTNKKRLTNSKVCADLNIMGVTPIKEIISEYLYTYFLFIDLGTLNNGSSIPQINNKDIDPLIIEIPPIELQNKFAEFVKQIDKQKFEIENSLKEMQELYESLMEKYFG